MNKTKILEEIENRYNNLNEKDKAKLIKNDKISFLAYNIIFSSLSGIISLIFYVLMFIAETLQDKYLCLAFAIILSITFILCITLLSKAYKKNDEQRIKRQLKYKIQAEIEEEKRKISKYNDDSIVSVTIIDSYTEFSDKLHALLNYQEIIQTRYYKFKIDYKDGSSKVVTIKEGSEEYENLINKVNVNKNINNSKTKKELLTELKELLEANLITQEEFDNKKKEILDN